MRSDDVVSYSIGIGCCFYIYLILIIAISSVHFLIVITNKYSTRCLHIVNGSRHFATVKGSRIWQESEQEAHKNTSVNLAIYTDLDIGAQLLLMSLLK